MVQAIAHAWRKKYGMAMIMLIAGIVLSFKSPVSNGWSAGEYTMFCSALLAIFGTSDLIDKDKIGPLKPKE